MRSNESLIESLTKHINESTEGWHLDKDMDADEIIGICQLIPCLAVEVYAYHDRDTKEDDLYKKAWPVNFYYKGQEVFSKNIMFKDWSRELNMPSAFRKVMEDRWKEVWNNYA